MQLKLPIAALVTELDFENLENAMGYFGAEITGYRVDRGGQMLEVDLAEDAPQEQVRDKLESLVRKLRPLRQRAAANVYLDRSTAAVPCAEDVLSILLARRDVVFHSPGVCALHGKLQRMYRALDQRLLTFALSQSAEQATYPVTIRLETLKRSNFFSHYPQFATFQSTLSADPDNISQAAKKLASDDGLDFLNHLSLPQTMCRSAGCLHAYPSHADEVFEPDRMVCVTMLGRMFRNEGRNVSGLERLNEYSMREIIYLGSPSFVAERLTECRDWCADYLERFQLRGVIQPANDPFFADNLAALQYFQRSEQTKHEFRLINPFTANSISVASINHHGEHFSKAYNIKFGDGAFIRTGCFGVGYERILFVTLAQYGYEESAWPEPLRDFYFGADLHP